MTMPPGQSRPTPARKSLPWITGTRIDVRTRSDMLLIKGEGSERSFWNVLIDNSNRSELVDALLSAASSASSLTVEPLSVSVAYLPSLRWNSQSQQVDVYQLSNLNARRNDILDHLREKALHVPALRYARDDPLHPLQPLPIRPTLQQLGDLLELVIGRVKVCRCRGGCPSEQREVSRCFLRVSATPDETLRELTWKFSLIRCCRRESAAMSPGQWGNE